VSLKNQQLKHLNACTIRAQACFKAINSGACKRLSKLKTTMESNKNLPLDKICPQHFEALQHIGPVTKIITNIDPTIATQ